MNPWRGLKDLPRNMWLLFSATLINRSGTMVIPFLALYLTQQIGFTPVKSGLVLTFYGIAALITAPVIGRFSDKIGSLKIMKLSLILTGFVFFLYPFVKSFTLIVLVTIILSIISEAFRPANLSVISHIVKKEQRRTGYALNRLAINLGMSVGPVIGGILAAINFSMLFFIDGLTSIIAGIFLIFSSWQQNDAEADENTEINLAENNKNLKAFSDRRLIYFLFAYLPLPLIYMQLHAAMPVYLVRDLHFSPASFGFLFAVNTILIILVEVPLNNLLGNWSDRKLLSTGAILVAVGFGATAFASSFLEFGITIIIWTFGEMIIFPGSSTYIAEIAPANKRGEYMGLYQMTFNLAFSIGPWLGMTVFENYGAKYLWLGTFMLGILSSLLMLAVKPKSKFL